MGLGIYAVDETIYFRVNTVDTQGSATDATAGPFYRIYKYGGTSPVTTGTMTLIDAANTGGFYEANIDTSGYDTGQYFIYVYATVDGENPATTIGFQLVSADRTVKQTFDDIETIVEATPNIGDGSVSIDHDYGGTDNYRVLSASGKPIADVQIKAYTSTDYNNGRKSNTYIVGQTETKSDGRWKSVIRLDPGTYVFEFSKRTAFKTKTASITVS